MTIHYRCNAIPEHGYPIEYKHMYLVNPACTPFTIATNLNSAPISYLGSLDLLQPNMKDKFLYVPFRTTKRVTVIDRSLLPVYSSIALVL